MWKKYKLIHYFEQWLSQKKINKQRVVIISDEEYTVRNIRIQDINKLLSIEREVYGGQLPWNKTAFLSELCSTDVHQYLLIKKAKQPIGFAGCRIVGTDAHVTNITISTMWQRKGLGQYLMKEIQQFSLANQCETLSLEVRLSNRNAQRFYRRLGFVSNRIKENYYSEDNEDALEMVLHLKKNDTDNL